MHVHKVYRVPLKIYKMWTHFGESLASEDSDSVKAAVFPSLLMLLFLTVAF